MQRPQLGESEQAKGAWVWEPVSCRVVRPSGGRQRRSRAACNATSGLLAAASLAQLCALAVGGAWLLTRLRALEASHERLLGEAACGCSSTSAVSVSTSAEDTAEASRVGPLSSSGDRGEAAATSRGWPRFGGDQQVTENARVERSLQRRSLGRRARPSASSGSRPTLPASSDQQMSIECRGHIAHFEFRNASINPNDFRYDIQRSTAETALVMTSLAGSDRWYPNMQQYEVGGYEPRAIKYMSVPHWLRHRSCSENSLAAFIDGYIEVKKEGLYLIYAQIGFVGTSSSVGFTIKRRTAYSVAEHSIASCELQVATVGRRQPATCAVTTVHRLYGGDSLSIVPIGAVRVMLREDYSFAGLVQLA